MSDGATYQKYCEWVNRDDSPAILVCSDAHGSPVAANLTARRFIATEGLSAWSDMFMPPDHEVWGAAIRRACLESTPVFGNYRLRRFDNAVREFVVRGEPRYSSSGAFVGHIVAAMDVSELLSGVTPSGEPVVGRENSSVQRIVGSWHDHLVSTSTVVSASAEMIEDLLPRDVSPMCRAAIDELLRAVGDLREQIQTLSSVARSTD